MSATFSFVKLQGWRQFGRVEIELHPSLTIITGANGAGKSSLLRVFSRHFGWDRPFLATPVRDDSGRYSYVTGLFSGIIGKIWRRDWLNNDNVSRVGTIRYSTGYEAYIQVPNTSNVQFSLSILNQQHVDGIHIDSHAPFSPFRVADHIPTNIMNAESAFNNYKSEIINKYLGNYTEYSPAYRMKEAIIGMALFGEGNKHVQRNSDILLAYNGFIEALRTMLPDSLGFIDISIRPPPLKSLL